MKRQNTFAEIILSIIQNKKYDKINSFLKNNIWLIPAIYFLGTVILIIRNQMLSLPFYPLSLLQFAVLSVYLLVFLIIYVFIEESIFSLVDAFCKKKERIKNVIFCFLISIPILIVLSVILDNIAHISIVFIMTIMISTLNLYYSKHEIIYIFTIVMYMSFSIFIPISMGGFYGQKVTYCDGTKKYKYTYYGNYDGMYQFTDDEKVYLIPIENGYIYYNRNHKKGYYGV